MKKDISKKFWSWTHFIIIISGFALIVLFTLIEDIWGGDLHSHGFLAVRVDKKIFI